MVEFCPADYDYKELQGKDAQFATTEEYNIETGTIEATREFIGPWDKRLDFIQECILPPTEVVGTIGVYRAPARLPGWANVFASRVSVTGKGKATKDANSDAKWERAHIKIFYKERNFNAAEGQTVEEGENNLADWMFIEESTDPEMNLLNVESRNLQIKGTEPPTILEEERDYSVPFLMTTVNLRQSYIVRPFWEILDAYIGHINSDIFICPSGRIFKPGHLRYDGYPGRTRVNIFDLGGIGDDDSRFPTPLWELEHQFVYHREGWNKVYYKGAWVEVEWVDTDPPVGLFPKADLMKIFGGFPGDVREQLLLNIELYEGIVDTLNNEDIPDDLREELLDSLENIALVINTLMHNLGWTSFQYRGPLVDPV